MKKLLLQATSLIWNIPLEIITTHTSAYHAKVHSLYTNGVKLSQEAPDVAVSGLERKRLACCVAAQILHILRQLASDTGFIACQLFLNAIGLYTASAINL
jgi:hypothetical protein